MSKLITIERHILEEQKNFPHATGTFTSMMYDIALIGKIIARETTRAGLVDILGRAGNKNVQGEEQQKLDVFADKTIFRMMDHTGRLCIMASEEHEDPLHIPDHYDTGPYAMLYDPLDGSSNINYNVSIGTIFSFYRKISPGDRGTLDDLLQPGYKQVAAGYVVYGASTMMVYSAGRGVHGYTLDPSIGEFLLSHPNIQIPENPRYYSINHGYERYWSEGIKRYADWVKDYEFEADGRPSTLSMRYVGSMVADFHRTLLSGGVFAYPADKKDPDKPHGKLRLTYECAPMAFLAEQAGAYASDGIGSILDIQPTGLHQRVPFFVGNRELVEKAEELIAEYDQDWAAQYTSEVREVPVPEVVPTGD